MKNMHKSTNSRADGRCFLNTAVSLICFSAYPVQAANDIDQLSEEMFFREIPVVLSATRLSQPLTETPAAITVIDREMIEASGAIELVDLFRLVPGFQVGFFKGSKFSVTYHGNTDRFSRDMQVLIDGRSVYDPAFGGVAWSDLQLDIDDIHRIEVIRGPNAAAYGSNSFSGVINIITIHPAEQVGTSVKSIIGQGGRRQINGRHVDSIGDLSYRLSLKYDENDGFDTSHDSSNTRWLNFRGDYEPTGVDSFLVEFGYSSGLREEGFEGDIAQPPRDNNNVNHYQQLRWTRHIGPGSEVSFQAYHNYQKIDDDFSAFLGIPIAFGYGFESERYDIELQHTLEMSPSQRIVWGVGSRQDRTKSIWTFNSHDWITRNQYRGFINLEWRLQNNLLLNLGGMYEKFQKKSALFSPRVALNLKLDKSNTLRFIATKAYRMPTLWEDNADLVVFSSPGMVPVQQLYLTQNNLDPQEIRSFEIGYLGQFMNNNLTVDAKIFREEMKDMIAGVVDQNVGYSIYMNDGVYSINGIELGLRIDPTPKSMIHFSYSLVTHDDGMQLSKINPSQTRVFVDRTPQQTFSLLGSYRFNSGIQLSSALYYMDSIIWAGDGDIIPPSHRLDIKLTKQFELPNADGDISLILQNIDSDFTDFYNSPDDNKQNIWTDRIFVQARLNWH